MLMLWAADAVSGAVDERFANSDALGPGRRICFLCLCLRPRRLRRPGLANFRSKADELIISVSRPWTDGFVDGAFLRPRVC